MTSAAARVFPIAARATPLPGPPHPSRFLCLVMAAPFAEWVPLPVFRADVERGAASCGAPVDPASDTAGSPEVVRPAGDGPEARAGAVARAMSCLPLPDSAVATFAVDVPVDSGVDAEAVPLGAAPVRVVACPEEVAG